MPRTQIRAFDHGSRGDLARNESEHRLEERELTAHSSTTAMKFARAVLWYDEGAWCPTSNFVRRSFGSHSPQAFAAHM